MPRDTAISGVAPAALPKVRRIGVKLPPANRDSVAVCRVNRNRRLICGVADDVVPIRIDVDLVTSEGAVRGDHSRRSFQAISARRGRGHVVFFQRLWEAPLG